jgi:hypothetical protein
MNNQLTPMQIWESNKNVVPYWYSNMTPFVSGNGVRVKNQIVAVMHKDRNSHFVSTADLWELFSCYSNAEQGFTQFIEDRSTYRAPNTSLTKFQYDPFSGEYIHWDWIKKIYAEHLVELSI